MARWTSCPCLERVLTGGGGGVASLVAFAQLLKGLAQHVGVAFVWHAVGMEMVGGARALVRSLSEEAWILVRLRRKRNDC